MDGSPEAKSALTAITKWTKQTDEASVSLISSEFGYSIKNVIVIGEVPGSDMMKMLQQDWGMTNSLAEKFYKYFGKVFVELLGHWWRHLHQQASVGQPHKEGGKVRPLCGHDCPGAAFVV